MEQLEDALTTLSLALEDTGFEVIPDTTDRVGVENRHRAYVSPKDMKKENLCVDDFLVLKNGDETLFLSVWPHKNTREGTTNIPPSPHTEFRAMKLKRNGLRYIEKAEVSFSAISIPEISFFPHAATQRR
ncbi:MAG: uncharacterized protein A8A55_3540 [Amphiamblys sp. WSBS2006]|nr:MAG: uncharacterized protein A8A55_3540 [Amphiamblys sp. WSBS2006]